MLQVKNLYFDYSEHPILKNVNFTVQSGSLLHLRGNNGSGKTTLLKIIAALRHPDRGAILYQGKDIKQDTTDYQKNLSYVGHKPGISLLMTVEENCLFDIHPASSSSSFYDLLQQFALDGFEKMPCSLLSAGQRKRVGLLKLLLRHTPIWLLDEPFVSLDHFSVELLMSYMRRHLDNNGLIVMSSHQLVSLDNINYQEFNLG